LADADFRRFMKDGIDAIERASHHGRIADVSVNEFSFGVQVLRGSVAVHLGHQQVENAHLMAALNQSIGQVRSDESRSACDQNIQLL